MLTMDDEANLIISVVAQRLSDAASRPLQTTRRPSPLAPLRLEQPGWRGSCRRGAPTRC